MAETPSRLKLWLDFFKVIIPAVVITGGLGLAGKVMNADYQNRKLDIERVAQQTRLDIEKATKAADIQSKIIEQEKEYLTAFLERALDANVESRFRFAQYFAALTHTEEYKSGWQNYLTQIEKEKSEIEKVLAEKEKIADEATGKELEVANVEIARLKGELDRKTLPSISYLPVSTPLEKIVENAPCPDGTKMILSGVLLSGSFGADSPRLMFDRAFDAALWGGPEPVYIRRDCADQYGTVTGDGVIFNAMGGILAKGRFYYSYEDE